MYFLAYFLVFSSILGSFFVHVQANARISRDKRFLQKQVSSATTPWIFAKVKIKGMLGKDRFLHYYALEPGQIFDEAKHKHSLATIEKELQLEGYLDARVSATKQYDTKNKTVLITLSLNPGSLFKIRSVSAVVVGVSQAERKKLQTQIQEMVMQDLYHQYALKEVINGEAQKIEDYLLSQGYVHAGVRLKTVREEKNTVGLQYTVTLDQKKHFQFVGNRFYSTQALLQELFVGESQGISIPLDILVEDMIAFYKKKGFYKIKVRVQKGKERVIFIINEGPRLAIYKVTVLGAPPDTEALLKKTLSDVYAMNMYDEDLIKQATDTLAYELTQLGYWSATVAKQELVIKRTKEGYGSALILEIKSGERHMITGIDIKGYPELLSLLTQATLPKMSKEQPLVLSPAHIEAQRKWLLDHFRQQGYLYVTLRYEFKSLSRKRAKGQILVWYVDTKGTPVRFGKTSITGLYRMKPEVVLRELCYKEGDVWDKEKIEQSLKRLRALGMFESITVDQPPIEQPIDQPVFENSTINRASVEQSETEQPTTEQSAIQRSPTVRLATEGLASEQSTTAKSTTERSAQPLIIKCVEDDPFEIRTRFGVQFVSKSFTDISWTTYKLGGTFIWKNPASIADQLKFDIDYTRFTRNIAASYELAWLGPCPVRTLFSAYSNRFDQPLSISREHRLYKEAHDGLSVTFNHLHPWWQSNIMVGFEINKLSGISEQLAKVIQFEPLLVDKNTPYVYVEPSITIEHCDNKNDPCKGFLTFISFKAMVPPDIRGGAFLRALVEQSFYHPLFFNLVGAIRLRFGHIFNARFSTILPTERFYLGGATTLRGYETNMVPPLNDLECSHKCLWVPVGGKSMVNINAELRFPIFRPISGVLFTDMGVLAQDKFADIAADKWLGATGFGLRCCTPIGPIRFDIGWKWKKRRPQDDPLAWFITFGHAF